MRGRNLGRDISVDSTLMVQVASASQVSPRLLFNVHWTPESMPEKIPLKTELTFIGAVFLHKHSVFRVLTMSVAHFYPQILRKSQIFSADGTVKRSSQTRSSSLAGLLCASKAI